MRRTVASLDRRGWLFNLTADPSEVRKGSACGAHGSGLAPTLPQVTMSSRGGGGTPRPESVNLADSRPDAVAALQTELAAYYEVVVHSTRTMAAWRPHQDEWHALPNESESPPPRAPRTDDETHLADSRCRHLELAQVRSRYSSL